MKELRQKLKQMLNQIQKLTSQILQDKHILSYPCCADEFQSDCVSIYPWWYFSHTIHNYVYKAMANGRPNLHSLMFGCRIKVLNGSTIMIHYEGLKTKKLHAMYCFEEHEICQLCVYFISLQESITSDGCPLNRNKEVSFLDTFVII